MAHQYLTLAEFRAMARLPAEYIDAVELAASGYTGLQLQLETAYIDSILAKRYLTPFLTNGLPNAPLVVRRWLVDLVTLQVWLKRGLDATQQDAEIYLESARLAKEELQAAANAQDGLYELPLRADNQNLGTAKPRVHSYHETSPFLRARLQRCQGREEERQGRGTRR